MYRGRIVIAERDAQERKQIKEMLVRSGFLVVGEAEDGPSAVQMVRTFYPDLAIINVNLTGIDGLEVARIIEESRIAPILMLVPSAQRDIIDRVRETGVDAYVVQPVQAVNLVPVAEIAITNFQKVRALEKEVDELRESLESRKIIEKAKGILMRNLGLSENEAFKRLRDQSMRKRTSMKAVAEAIILAHEIKRE